MSLEERLKYAQMKARHKEVLLPWYKKWWGLIILIIGALTLALLLLASAYVINQVQNILSVSEEAGLEEQYALYSEKIKGDGTNFSTGPLNATVTIVEFGDFSCPFCRQSAPGLRRLAADYHDRVRIIYRDYPLHDNSIDLALAARCAGEQGRFWDMHDQFFIYKTETSATGPELRALLMGLAEEMELDISRFDRCLEDRRYVPQIKKDFDDGEWLEIAGTPTWFVNDYPITGHVPEASLRELVDGLLMNK